MINTNLNLTDRQETIMKELLDACVKIGIEVTGEIESRAFCIAHSVKDNMENKPNVKKFANRFKRELDLKTEQLQRQAQEGLQGNCGGQVHIDHDTFFR